MDPEGRPQMDVSVALSEFEEAVAVQLQLAGDDPAIEAAAASLLAALQPAFTKVALGLVEQAAAEVAAQLPDSTVDVVMSEGEPTIRVTSEEPLIKINTEDLAARLTVRLPDELKAELESAADEVGDSVNTYVVKTLTSRAGRSRAGRRIKGTFKT